MDARVGTGTHSQKKKSSKYLYYTASTLYYTLLHTRLNPELKPTLPLCYTLSTLYYTLSTLFTHIFLHTRPNPGLKPTLHTLVHTKRAWAQAHILKTPLYSDFMY